MDNFWQAALAVGGLGVVGAFVFYSLYKTWLKLPIFSKLTKRQTFTVVLSFLGLTFLALIAILYTYISSDDSHDRISQDAEGIAHVRTIVNRNDEDLPVLDITLRNNSDSVAVLTYATVTVRDRWHIGPVWILPSAMPVSFTYDVPVSGEVDQPARVPLSQELRPKTADRFELVLGPEESVDWWYPAIGQFIFLLDVELTYNEDSTSLTIPAVFTSLPPPWEVQGMYNPGPPPGALEDLLREAEDARNAAEQSDVIDKITLDFLNYQIDEIQEALQADDSE